MALITRLNKLFQADMHAVLDKIEEPEALLKQAIRDMEESVAQEEKQLKLCEVEREQLGKKAQQINENLTDVDNKLTMCFQVNKDDLARSIVKRKLEYQQTIQAVTEALTRLDAKAKQLTKQLGEHQTQLAEMRQKAEVFGKEPCHKTYTWDNTATIRDEDIEVAFLYEKQKWSGS